MCSGPRYTIYHARDWAVGKTEAEMLAEIAACEHKARTHHFQWNEVGNCSDTWTRADTLRLVLTERKAESGHASGTNTPAGVLA